MNSFSSIKYVKRWTSFKHFLTRFEGSNDLHTGPFLKYCMYYGMLLSLFEHQFDVKVGLGKIYPSSYYCCSN